ncbi:hypothetical protein ACFL2J_05905 [Candidatus Omnitrophota bacterium]
MKQSHKWVLSYNISRPMNYSLIFFYFKKITLCALLMFFCLFLLAKDGLAQEEERQPIKMRVVAVNPSADKDQTVPIKIYLPEEVTPKDIISSRDLDIEYDDNESMYYAYKEGVLLKPKETRVFEVEVRDVWIIPQAKLDAFGKQTTIILERLEESEFYDGAKVLGDAIFISLDIVARTQNDETVGRKQHIGIYRHNVKTLDEVKESIERLERLLTLASALPVPEILEKKQVKIKAPTKTTTWMIIFIIIVFMGMLAGVFFFTWHVQARSTKDFIGDARKNAFSKGSDSSRKGEGKG